MTANTRDWGLTILRLWAGFLIARSGYLKIVGNDIGFSNLISLQILSAAAWLNVGIHLIFLIGGAAIFLGIAVRLAALLIALATAYTIWENTGIGLAGLVEFPHSTTIFILCLVLILTGPGRLNMGAALRKRR